MLCLRRAGARKRGPAPPGHARTHADLSAASPRTDGPAPSCREALGGGRKGARIGWRLGGAAWGLKHQVPSPPGCDPATEALVEHGHPSHGSCDAASLPRASRVGGRKPRCSPCSRPPARASKRARARVAGSATSLPVPNGLVSRAAQPGRSHPPTASRARGTLRGFQGDNFALLQRAASARGERRHRQQGPLPTLAGRK